MEKIVNYRECYECGLIRRAGESKCPACGSKRVRRTGSGITEAEYKKRVSAFIGNFEVSHAAD